MTHAETEQRNILIRQDYLNGMSRPKIKEKYGIKNYVINYAVIGIKRKRISSKRVSKVDTNEMIRLHKLGLNHFDIGDRFGAAPRYIYDLLRNAGLEPYKIKRVKKDKAKKAIPVFIREELPPRLEALREKYKKMEVINESNQTFRIREHDLPFTVYPKRNNTNYSQVIWR